VVRKVPTRGRISETVAYEVAYTIPKAAFGAASHVIWVLGTVSGGRCPSGVGATARGDADARKTQG
jgi:hypothetical protein